MVCCWNVVSQTPPTVFKLSKWNSLHMIPMMSRCVWHKLIEAQPKGSRVMPLFRHSYILWQSVDRGLYSLQSVKFSLKFGESIACVRVRWKETVQCFKIRSFFFSFSFQLFVENKKRQACYSNRAVFKICIIAPYQIHYHNCAYQNDCML